MISPQAFVELLKRYDIEFFAGVPDSLLKPFCTYITEQSDKTNHIICANEGAAVGVGIGYHLATRKIPLVYMQNSGIGNAVNPLISLADPEVFSIPILLLIGWRGEPGVQDEPQHKKQGRVMEAMLSSMEIDFKILNGEMDGAANAVDHAACCMNERQAPFALVVKKGAFGSYPPMEADRMQQSGEKTFPLTREDVIQMIVDALGEEDIVVATTGMASRELFEYREKQGHRHFRDFLTVGGMGHASQIALGIACHKPNRKVFCLDGDGAVIMHMGSLAINGMQQSQNFHHLVINNGAYDSVGGQPTVGFDIRLTDVAKSVGYRTVRKAETRTEIQNSLDALVRMKGPSFLEIRVQKGARIDLGRPTIAPQENKTAFIEFLR